MILKTNDIMQYLKTLFPELASVMFNNSTDYSLTKSISILPGSSTRSQQPLAIGGIEATVIRALPINILVRWGANANECDNIANNIYETLLEHTTNFTHNKIRYACFQLLDSNPISLGRNQNVCEVSIRVNVIYYIN